MRLGSSRRTQGSALAAVAAVLAVVPILGAGCGGDDENLPLTGSTISQSVAFGPTGPTGAELSSLAAEANQICAAAEGPISAATESVPAELPEAERVRLVAEGIVPLLQGVIDAIAALPEAAADPAVSAFVDETQAVIDAVSADPGLLATDANPFEQADQAAQAAGLSACAA